MIPLNNLDSSSRLAIEIAQKLAVDHNHATFGAPHLLMALLNSRVGVTSLLTTMEKDLSYLKGWAQYRIDEYKTKGLPSDEPEADEKIASILSVARAFKLTFNLQRINATCLLAAICRPEVGFPKGQIRSLRLLEEEIVEAVLRDISIQGAMNDDEVKSETSSAVATPTHSPSSTKEFLKFCIDKLALAQQGKIDPIFGRDAEIGDLESKLRRRKKANAIIIGAPGVGKTALVDGFALKIAHGEVSEYFKTAKIYELDIGALVAGASYRGEVEDRLKKIIQEVKRLDNVILFIDEIHVIMDKNSGASGIANLLKPELARGAIKVIGATTTKEYRLHIEKDAAFARRFAIVEVEEPSKKNAVKMVNGLKELFENHYNFKLEDDVITHAVDMAKRYFSERNLPDSAIDLLDNTLASYRIYTNNVATRLEKVKASLEELPEEKDEIIWKNFWDEAIGTLSALSMANYDAKEPPEGSEPELWEAFVEQVLEHVAAHAAAPKEHIKTDDINAIVSIETNIPMGKIQSDEQEKLLKLEEILKSQVIGQDHAADIIARAIRRNRSGIGDAERPIGSFFLVGPTGTGKTELAKSITDTMFNDKNNLIRFDMSEFMEKHTVSMLTGSPPGYVGFGEGGPLVNKIRAKPYSVVLFDEVEKAHPDVLKVLLQVLDEGYIHDTLNMRGNFKDAIIIFTSNLESDWVVEMFEAGEFPEEDELRDRIVGSTTYNLRPEFLNRLDAIIPFSPLSKDDLVKILDLQLKRFIKPLKARKIDMELSPEAKAFMVDEGYSPEFGARPLKRVIDRFLGDRISEMLIAQELKDGELLKVDKEDGGLVFTAVAVSGGEEESGSDEPEVVDGE
jgi:ATP-dependent Clp protease ATP-binding subunit ClpB